jgi:diguanylate cyclase (GGDEF)-like protein/PAS domain S-box-containing protein
LKSQDSLEELSALRAEVEQFRLLANNLPAAIAYYEAGGFTCRYANPAYARMFGRDQVVGLTFAEVIGDEAARQIAPQVDALLKDRQRTSYERKLTDAAGQPRWIEVDLLPHVGPENNPVGAFVMISDISRHRAAELAARESEERLSKFLHASVEGIVFHKDGLITDANPPLLALIGRSLDDLLGRPALDFVCGDQRERVGAVMTAAAEISYETAIQHKDGTRLPVEFIVRTMRHQDEKLRMTIVRDLRDRIAARARIDFLAHHDALTGLPNRPAFTERAEAEFARATVRGDRLALMFVDLDDFKRVNDSLGHLAGDTLLQTVARRITEALRADDLVARFGGDEFVVLVAGDPSTDAAREIANKLLAAIGAPLEAGGAVIQVTPSIGVAMFPVDGSSPQTLIQHADIAMYVAKSSGRAHCRFFEPAMAAAAIAGLEMESRLVQALRDNEFVLHYQPQLALEDGRLVGIEALIRWRDADGTLRLPGEFVAVAESRRLMGAIGRWVLQQAIADARRWREAGWMDVPVAVNVTPLQFRAAGFVDDVEQVLQEAAADGRLLEIEITERMLMDDLPIVRETLERLKSLGVRVTVDDYGTGYSSLGRLKALPIDRLKIHRSFVGDLPGEGGAAAIVRATIQMARTLGLATVVEGIETEAQRDWARAHGGDAMQGRLACAPVDSNGLEDWLRSRR